MCLCRVRRGRAQSTPQLRKRSPRCFSLHCSHPDSFPAYLLISQSCAGPRATQQPRNEIWANRQGAVSEIELSNLDRARPRINKHHRHANYQPYRSNDPGSICEYILLKHETLSVRACTRAKRMLTLHFTPPTRSITWAC